MTVKFCPIASGSKGNCVYVGTKNTHILIDAGISGKRIQQGLNQLGIEGSKLDAIFITHEHSDHIKGAGILSRRFDIPIFATTETWNYMDRNNSLGAISQKNKMLVYKDEKIIMNDLLIRPFEIPHDGSEPVAYSIVANNYKLAVATDIGYITDDIVENLADLDILLIESNHDVEMLKNGSYPHYLKKRILSKEGHLSNVCTGQLLVQIMNNKLKHVFLGHLSDENNSPFTALTTVTDILEANDVKVGKDDLNLYIACRDSNSEVLIL